MDTLSFENIIKETRINKSFPQKYLSELYSYNMDFTMPVKSQVPLTSIKCFYPLPTRLLLTEFYTENHKIIKNKNEYEFHGASGNRIVFSDKKLPFVNEKLKYPIPFSFPICTDTEIEIVTSNVYYYEVQILPKENMTPWAGECISIGFGNKNTSFHTHVGWSSESIGFHSDDGTIRFNESHQVSKVHSDIWKPGDVAGAGIIYVSKNEIKPFFTFNGKLIYMSGKTIQMKWPYFPMIGYDHSHSIEMNFSTKPFVYDIKKLILKNSDNVISSENSFICDYDIGNILNEPPVFSAKPKIPGGLMSLLLSGLTTEATEGAANDVFNNNNFVQGISNSLLSGYNPNSNVNNNMLLNQHLYVNGNINLNPIQSETQNFSQNNPPIQFLNLNGPGILPNNISPGNITGVLPWELLISDPLTYQPSGLANLSLQGIDNNLLNIPSYNQIINLNQDITGDNSDLNSQIETINFNNNSTQSNITLPENFINLLNYSINSQTPIQIPNGNNMNINSLIVEGQNLFNFVNLNVNSSPVNSINSLTGVLQVNESNSNENMPNENNTQS